MFERHLKTPATIGVIPTGAYRVADGILIGAEALRLLLLVLLGRVFDRAVPFVLDWCYIQLLFKFAAECLQPEFEKRNRLRLHFLVIDQGPSDMHVPFAGLLVYMKANGTGLTLQP